MRNLLLSGLAALGLSIGTAHAGAFQLTFSPSDSFSGTPATGNIVATFTDIAPGEVQLVLQSNLGPGEFVGHEGFYFNTIQSGASAIDATGLSFTQINGTSLTPATSEPGNFKPDGDGEMNIQLSDGNNFFGNGSIITFNIFDAQPAFDAQSFNQLSDCSQGCGTGPHLAAAHLQNTPNGGAGSDWVGAHITEDCSGPNCGKSIGAPEPATIVLLGVGLLGLGLARRRDN